MNNDLYQFDNSGRKIYKGSTLDTYLESTVYNGFTAEVKNALNLMNVASNGETLQRHIVVPSLTELGITFNTNNSGYNLQAREGLIYSIFSPVCVSNPKAVFKPMNYNYSGVGYWSRNACGPLTDSGYPYVFTITGDGAGTTRGPSDKWYVIARIRFAKA